MRIVTEIIQYVPSLEETQASAEAEIINFATQTRADLTAHADQYKLSGWVKKSARAERVINNVGTDEDITILQTECEKRDLGETPESLAAKQLEKSKSLDIAIAIIDGLESAALAAIKSCEKVEDIETILNELKANAEQELAKLTGESE